MWKLDYKENWALKNWCFWAVVLEKTLESPLDCKEIQPVHPKGNHSWIFVGRTDAWSWSSTILATRCKELTHRKRPWSWERLKAKGEGDDRGWEGWMASPTHWAWVWVNSRSWWWTRRPGVLQSQRSDTTERLKQTEPQCMSALTSSPLPPGLTETKVLFKKASQGLPWWSSG